MLRRAFGSAFSADEIEDIYSSAWLGTLRALARRQQDLADDEIRKYVLTAVAHQASKELRRRRRRPTSPLDDAPEVLDPVALSPEEYAASSEDRGLARELLVTLPPRRRAVMLLRYGWGDRR
jgi:RNA polymerase sigma factor (sigma-70 family)